MNKFTRFVSLALVLCMMLTMVPFHAAAAESDSDSYAYSIVHVDAGRKYFSVESLKTIIDNAADAGFNQVELYLSDNQGFRFALEDMTLTTDYGTYDLTDALGDGYGDGSKYPDYSGRWLTQAEMDEVISYANSRQIDIVPCINVPGHMGAILEEFSDFRYTSGYQTSKSSIDLENDEAVAFALALTEKYAAYFASRGCKFYNVGADEYANDLSSMGFEGMGATLYTKFVEFLNDAAEIVIAEGMTPRAFNDGFYYKDYSISVEPNKAYEICYWSSGWSGYDVAAASTIAAKGHKMINTHGDYYWVLGNSSWQCSASKASRFDVNTFQGSTISAPAGAMFCIWCDVANTDGTDGGTAVAANTADVIAAFGGALPETESLISSGETTEPVTVTKGDVSVSAPDLTDMTVTEAEAPAVDGASEVVAYDVVPLTAEGAYTGSAELTITIPAGWTNVRGGVLESANGEEALGITGKLENGKFTFTAPHFSTVVVYDVAAADVEVTEERTITVSVGKTATDTVIGGEYAADETELDKSIATVSVTTTPAQEATVAYTEASVTVNNLISNNSTQVSTGYYYQVNGSYYPLYASRTSRSSWGSTTYTYTWYYSVDNGATFTQIGTQSTNSTRSTPNITVYTMTGTEAVEASTAATFTGVAVGTTYVTVGNVRYTINVIAEDLSQVDGLPVEFWVTNRQVTANGATSMTISAEDAYKAEGVALSDLVPAEGSHESNVMKFWKGTRHASGSHQDDGVDRTATGTDFAYIRYYNGAWAYSADGKTWTNVASNDQLVAYYLQSTQVTDEVETLVVDWGVIPSTSYNSSNFVLVDYAVKYESGERTPASFPVSGKTQAFHCDPNDTNTVHQYNGGNRNTWYNNYREIKMIKANETSEYEVYMITLTPTSDSQSTAVASNANAATSYNYGGTEKVVWVDDEANLGDFASDDKKFTSISGAITYTVGGEPIVAGLEIFNRHGMLVTYYVRAKATEDSLTVHYIDTTASATDLEFYTYNIAVKEGVLFNANIALNTANPNGNLLNGDVENYYGRTQTVSADLSTLSQIGAQYLYTEYNCVRVERSGDGKHVYLYYTFDPTVYLVADFGLPITMTAAQLSDKLADVTIEDMAFSGTSLTTYGQLVDNGATVSYVPNKTIDGVDFFTLMVKTENKVDDILDEASDQIAFRVYVTPATTVYYEEGFASYTGSWTGGSKGDVFQETDTNVDTDAYGHTAAYNSIGASNGTEAVSATGMDEAEFTFSGTGVDVYANCDTDTSVVMVRIYDANGSLKKMYQVDTVAKAGDSTGTAGQAVESYNLPIVSVTDLDYGTYTVNLLHTKAAKYPDGTANSEVLRIDGFRVYNPLNNLASSSYVDAEKSPSFADVRDNVLAGLSVETNANFNSYVDDLYSQVYTSAGTVAGALVLGTNPNVQDLLDKGPKNELFLQPGNTLTINISGNAQIGLKAVSGAASYTITGKNGTQTMTSSTDMFYKVSGAVTIQNTGNTLLSITKLKLAKDTTLGNITTQQVAYALSLMGMASEDEVVDAPEQEVYHRDAELTVNVVDYNGRKLGTVELTANGVQGESHTFTAEEIVSAAKAQLPASYSLVDESKVADVLVDYGKTAVVRVQAGKTAVVKITYVDVRTSAVVGEAEIVSVQADSQNWVLVTAADLRVNAPAGRTALKLQSLKAAYGYSYSLVIQVI